MPIGPTDLGEKPDLTVFEMSTNMITSMRALILEAPLQMSLQQVDIPTLGEGELLVKVRAATTCGTDLKAFRRGHPAIPMPGRFGHEYSGTVVAAGPGSKFEVGQDVMGVHSAPCQACYWCRHGQENLCETIVKTMVMGSFAEYIKISSRIANLNVYEKPHDVDFKIASLLEPFACVAQGVQELQKVVSFGRELPKDAKVLIIGPGAIGLMFVAALKLSGIEQVTLAGRNQSRLAVGESFGANAVFLTELHQSDFDIVIECTGQVEIWEKSIDFSRRGGTVMLFGGCASGTRASFDTGRLHYDQITLVSPFHFGTDAVRTAREWIISNKIDLSPIISGSRTLEQAAETFEDLQAGKGIKYVFEP